MRQTRNEAVKQELYPPTDLFSQVATHTHYEYDIDMKANPKLLESDVVCPHLLGVQVCGGLQGSE
jgi:hypothetical protein